MTKNRPLTRIDIVNYEYIDSSRDDLIKKGFSNKEIKNFQANMKKYIKEKIKDNVGYTNIQFRKFKRDYKSFLLVFFVWIILGLFNLIENLQDKILKEGSGVRLHNFTK